MTNEVNTNIDFYAYFSIIDDLTSPFKRIIQLPHLLSPLAGPSNPRHLSLTLYYGYEIFARAKISQALV